MKKKSTKIFIEYSTEVLNVAHREKFFERQYRFLFIYSFCVLRSCPDVVRTVEGKHPSSSNFKPGVLQILPHTQKGLKAWSLCPILSGFRSHYCSVGAVPDHCLLAVCVSSLFSSQSNWLGKGNSTGSTGAG